MKYLVSEQNGAVKVGKQRELKPDEIENWNNQKETKAC